MDFIIRKAIISDLDLLCFLFDAYRVFYKKESDVISAKQFMLERLQAGDSNIIVAELQGSNELLGFTQLYPLFSSTRMRRLWLLNDLYVKEEFRGKGISKNLIEASKQLAIDTQACGLLLETEKTNLIGNKLYPSTDFVLEQGSNFYFWTNNL